MNVKGNFSLLLILLEYYDLLYLDALGGSDDPPVGDERGATFVLELAALVLPQTHLLILYYYHH